MTDDTDEQVERRPEPPQEDDEEAYEQDDPKHPTFHERAADLWDNREKGA